jgi:hypothetical protein
MPLASSARWAAAFILAPCGGQFVPARASVLPSPPSPPPSHSPPSSLQHNRPLEPHMQIETPTSLRFTELNIIRSANNTLLLRPVDPGDISILKWA